MSSKLYAFCFVKNSDDLYLTLLRSETCRNRPHDWDLPGGTADVGESGENAAIREAHEEAGIKIERVEPLIDFGGEYQGSGHYFEYFNAEYNGPISLSSEHCRFEWVTLQELVQRLTYKPHHAAARHLLAEEVASDTLMPVQ